MAETAVAEKTQYQGQMHLLQKEMMGRYFERVTRAAEQGEGKAVYMLISGNPVELIQAFDLIPVYPEIDALQLAAKKSALPFILKAEELGYSMDNCAYVKADVGMFLGDRKTPFATIPLPSLILCNYVGCNVYLQWFEHLAEYCDGQLYNLDIPFLRDPSGVPSPEDVTYVVRQLEEVIEICERLTGKKLDYARLKQIVSRSSETGEMWSRIKGADQESTFSLRRLLRLGDHDGAALLSAGNRRRREIFRNRAQRDGRKSTDGNRAVTRGALPLRHRRTAALALSANI